MSKFLIACTAISAAMVVVGVSSLGVLYGRQVVEDKVEHDCRELGAVEIRGRFYSCEFRPRNLDELPPS